VWAHPSVCQWAWINQTENRGREILLTLNMDRKGIGDGSERTLEAHFITVSFSFFPHCVISLPPSLSLSLFLSISISLYLFFFPSPLLRQVSDLVLIDPIPEDIFEEDQWQKYW
jgi:hypothetical protein